MLGNITLDMNYKPIYSYESIFKELPNFLQETAFIDRIHGIIPGWELPLVSKDTPSCSCLGFKGDFFSEILHRLRGEVRYADFVKLHMRFEGCNDLRDRKATLSLATAYLKLSFPDLKSTEQEFRAYCIEPASELRQKVRDELHRLDTEYAPVRISVAP